MKFFNIGKKIYTFIADSEERESENSQNLFICMLFLILKCRQNINRRKE